MIICVPYIYVATISLAKMSRGTATLASPGSAWNEVFALVWNRGVKGQSSLMSLFLSLAASVVSLIPMQPQNYSSIYSSICFRIMLAL